MYIAETSLKSSWSATASVAKQMTLISYGSNGQKITPADEGNLSDLGQKKVDVSV